MAINPKHHLLLLLLIAVDIAAAENHQPTNIQQQHSIKTDAAALLMFKHMITSDPNNVLSTWIPTRNPCSSSSSSSSSSWYGVTCNSNNNMGRITELDLTNASLSADSISFDAFSSMELLSSLKLSSNNFTFTNSTSLLRLPPSLQHLHLHSTGLTGPFLSKFISSHPNLLELDLSHNNLTMPNDDQPSSSFVDGEDSRLQFLDLSDNNFTGPIAFLIQTASLWPSLLHLDLSKNHLTGAIPNFISNCTSLQTINLSFNLLSSDIPELGATLQRLDLSHNHLTGWIPRGLGTALVEIKLSSNNISGSIPDSLANCSYLQLLDLSTNNISGPFPDSILQHLTSLETLLLSSNQISGPFPSSISHCKNLRVADFSSNRLSGDFPPDICPAGGGSSLEELRLPDNLISGPIPGQLSRCTKLKTIDFSLNYLNGSIPAELGELEDLEQLLAWFNGLEGRVPPELGKCRNLKDVILNNNHLTGPIPAELFGCSSLEWISLTSNEISGQIPNQVGQLPRLAVLQLANNSLSGEIPPELGNCSSLVWLDLNSNKLTGEIPPRLGRQLGSKALTAIPSGSTIVFVRNVGNSCKGVGGLLEFAGIRPERLLQIPTLKSCDFTRLYSGPVLSLFTQYQTLEYLDLSYNELRGKIPDEFGNMMALQVLELSHNRLSGEIPVSLGQLKNLGVFDASHNRLQGEIPDSFSNLSFLVQIDLSNNELTGQIPQRGQLSTLPATQYANNPGLCGVPLPECRLVMSSSGAAAAAASRGGGSRRASKASTWANSVVLGVLISVASVCILVVWAIAMRVRHKESQEAKMLQSLQASHAATTWKIEKEKEPLSINVATFQRQLRKLKFSQLIEATNGFSGESMIGCGGFGEVFKATLKDGSCVAIKKLIRLSCQGDREFMAEMETLGKIKHRNLVPLLGYCKVGEERLLVYEYMQFGSLEEVLHGRRAMRTKGGGEAVLTWEERKKIARGAAKGLCFLHHNCIPHIIHRDMKSSNVLLDKEMEARVSDFGMARLISALDTHLSVSTLAGTPGYVPPEYYQSFRCTAKGDVYSLGVVLLELVTGKRPTDKEDFGDTNLVGWVKMKVREGKQMEVIDPDLLPMIVRVRYHISRQDQDQDQDQHQQEEEEEEGKEEEEEVKEMVRYLEITLQCVDDFPSKRPNMLQVVAMLRELNIT